MVSRGRSSPVITNDKWLGIECPFQTRGGLFRTRFRLELPGIDPITAAVRQIDRDRPGTRIGFPQPFHQSLRIGKIGKRTHLHPQHSHFSGTALITDHAQFDLIGSTPDHPDSLGPSK